MSSIHPIQALSNQAYFADITRLVASTRSGSRIGLTTMVFDPRETLIGNLMRELIAAAKRGVQVCMLVDAHSFMVDADGHGLGPLLKHGHVEGSSHPEFAYKYDQLQALAAAGGHYSVINKPRSRMTLPMAGRSHIKTVIVDDQVYVGGCNLGGSEQIDCMVRFADKSVANWIFKLITDVAADGSMRHALHGADCELQLDSHTTIFVDAGKRNQSLILRQALQLIDEAEQHILITCQFFPNSVTASHLERARRRGVKVEVYYNHPAQQTKFFGVVQQAVLLGERLRLHQELFMHQLPKNHQRLHAKIIATDKGAIIGSHNYVTLGVQLGTAEMALVRHDPDFSQQLIEEISPSLI